jgi:hypothetical protein
LFGGFGGIPLHLEVVFHLLNLLLRRQLGHLLLSFFFDLNIWQLKFMLLLIIV